jgi:hypothetical protein
MLIIGGCDALLENSSEGYNFLIDNSSIGVHM